MCTVVSYKRYQHRLYMMIVDCICTIARETAEVHVRKLIMVCNTHICSKCFEKLVYVRGGLVCVGKSRTKVTLKDVGWYVSYVECLIFEWPRDNM